MDNTLIVTPGRENKEKIFTFCDDSAIYNGSTSHESYHTVCKVNTDIARQSFVNNGRFWLNFNKLCINNFLTCSLKSLFIVFLNDQFFVNSNTILYSISKKMFALQNISLQSSTYHQHIFIIIPLVYHLASVQQFAMLSAVKQNLSKTHLLGV